MGACPQSLTIGSGHRSAARVAASALVEGNAFDLGDGDRAVLLCLEAEPSLYASSSERSGQSSGSIAASCRAGTGSPRATAANCVEMVVGLLLAPVVFDSSATKIFSSGM